MIGPCAGLHALNLLFYCCMLGNGLVSIMGNCKHKWGYQTKYSLQYLTFELRHLLNAKK